MATMKWQTVEERAAELERLAQKETSIEDRFDQLLDILLESKVDKDKIKKLKEKK